jgi:hypothetical protein
MGTELVVQPRRRSGFTARVGPQRRSADRRQDGVAQEASQVTLAATEIATVRFGDPVPENDPSACKTLWSIDSEVEDVG